MDNSKIRISVIIPNYNHGMFIEQSIRSVMDSDFDSEKMEVIVVDDASTDKSVAIIESIMPESSVTIRLLQNDTNIGAARSRNRGIVNARGTFVYFLDADDYLHKQCLRRLFDFMSQHPEFIACYAPQQEFLNSSGKLLNLRSNKPFDYFELLKGPYISGVALFKATVFRDAGIFNTNMPPYGWIDYELWLRLGKMGKKVHFLQGEPLYFYRLHENCITKGIDYNKMKSLIDFLRIEHPLEFDIVKGIGGKIDYIPFARKEAQLFLTESEEDSVKELITQETQHFEFKINPPRNVKTLRFDPINDFATIKINSIQLRSEGHSADHPIKITSNAAIIKNDQLLFDTADPQVYFEMPDFAMVDTVSITIHYLKTGSDAIFDIQQIKKLELETISQRADELAENVKTSARRIERLIEEKNKNYLLFLETLSNYTRILANPVIRAMAKVLGFLDTILNSGFLGKAKEKIQLKRQVRMLKNSALFDPHYYRSVYTDVAETNMSPEIHYLHYGWREGRNPSPDFITSYYLTNNPDVLSTRKNPLVHYIKKGQFENRKIKPGTDQNPKSAILQENKSAVFQFLQPGQDKLMLTPHFSPPTNDFALEVPFEFEDFAKETPGKIAVFCHVFYPEVSSEIIHQLRNIPYPFDIYITTNTTEKQEKIRRAFAGHDKGKVEVEVAENRGRDIAPKLIAWHEIYRKYDYCLHLHTKKSPHDIILNKWRDYLYDTLTGSENTVRSIFEAFGKDQQLGMIAPQHFTNARQAVGWGFNFDIAQGFAQNLEIHLNKDGAIDFPSGSMFWARTKALKPLLDAGLTYDNFPAEAGQTDGTLAHAIERLFFFVCEKAGYKWIKILKPDNTPFPQRAFKVEKPYELAGLINQVATNLLDEKGINVDKNISFGLKEIYQHLHFLKVHQLSPYRHLEPDAFIKALNLHNSGKESLIDFDEAFYLKANPDIARLVASGVYECGFIHYCQSGQSEKRAWSNRMLLNRFNLLPNYPSGMFEPVNIRLKHQADHILLPATKSPYPYMLILFGHLQKDLFYAGYNAFFKDFLPVFEHFTKIVIAVDTENIETELATDYCNRIEVVKLRNLSAIEYSPDVLICFSNHLVTKAMEICPYPERIVYYCQEFESGFFPFGKAYIEAESAIAKSKNIILSTELLRIFLEQEGLIRQNNVFVTSPEIEVLEVAPEKTKKLFFYFRPEYFHTRNIPEIIWEAVHEFCSRHTGYELYLAGTIETHFSITLNGNEVYVLSKLPKEEYYELITSCDVAVTMIYSAHPGVIAFQAAASGIPTITNIFKNRDARTLKAISENIIPFDPVRETLCDKVDEALSKAKGNKHFNRELYAGPPQPVSLSDFILKIMNR